MLLDQHLPGAPALEQEAIEKSLLLDERAVRRAARATRPILGIRTIAVTLKCLEKG
jgi:hypothetical protein